MNISSSNFSNSMMQQVQQSQRNTPPSSSELSSKIMETNDIDGDSLLSIEELNLSEEKFSSMDTDGDGSLSGSDIESSLSSMLDNMKNQKTSPQEFGEILSNMGLEVPPPPQKGGRPDVQTMASDIFSSNDADSNGLLSIKELGISEDIFTSLDGNEDGSITQEELSQGLTTLFSSIESGEMSKDEAGEVLSQLGVPPPPQGGGKPQGGGGGESSSDSEYEDADTNQDGVVSASEYAAYYGSDSQDSMSEYTMDLVSTLMDALKSEQTENGTDDDIDLSKFKQVMSMVNEQIQDPKTSEMLDKYISQM